MMIILKLKGATGFLQNIVVVLFLINYPMQNKIYHSEIVSSFKIFKNNFMNKLFLFALLATSCCAANAQVVKEINVPATVKAKFISLYPDKPEVKWEKEKSNYEAAFEQNKMEVSVLFEENGTIVQTETEILVSALPKAVTDYITKNLAGKKINEATKITDAKGKITYEAEVGKVDYLFDENGKFISKEEDNEDDEDDAR